METHCGIIHCLLSIAVSICLFAVSACKQIKSGNYMLSLLCVSRSTFPLYQNSVILCRFNGACLFAVFLFAACLCLFLYGLRHYTDIYYQSAHIPIYGLSHVRKHGYTHKRTSAGIRVYVRARVYGNPLIIGLWACVLRSRSDFTCG